MGSRKKRPPPSPPSEGQAGPPQPAPAEPERPLPLAPAPVNGQAVPAPAAPSAPPADPPRPDLSEVLKDAEKWAMESGLRQPFTLSGPSEVPYPQYGRGYVVVVHEQTGKCRLGTAKFGATGRRTMWTIDGTYAV